MIDPGPDLSKHIDDIIDIGDGKIKKIFITHTHQDHSPGAKTLSKRLNLPIYGCVTEYSQIRDLPIEISHKVEHQSVIASSDHEIMPFLGSHSAPASEATYCADDQGKYWEYHTMLFRFQEDEIDGGWASATRLQAFAFNLGLDIEQFDKCMTTDDHKALVNSNMQIARNEFGANSTPTFMIINTSTGEAEKIVGAHPYSTFVSVIDQML